MSVVSTLLANILAILAKDTGGAAVSALNAFKASVDQTSDPQEVVAAGVQLEGSLVTALPSVESALIKDTTNLLVTDLVGEITGLQAQAQVDAAAAGNAAATSTAG